MEVVVCAITTAAWWISSMTVLLPLMVLLKFSKKFQFWFFSRINALFISRTCEPKLVPYRKMCFDMLGPHLRGRDPTVPLRLLEIGIGTGRNLLYYPENTKLTAVDINPSFETFFKANRRKYPQVELDRTVLTMAEDMKEVEDASVDIVVSTYVLCSVSNVEDVLNEVKRVLVKGGHFLFLEHVSFPENEWSSKVQRWVSPLWSLYFAGCCPDRNLALSIEKAKFNKVTIDNLCPYTLLMFIRPQIMGVATK